MNSLELIESFSEFKDDKLINRETLMAILEEVFRNTLKKKYGSDDNFDIIINPDKGDLQIFRNRIVVEDGTVTNDNQEIALSVARKIEPDFEVGEDVSEEIKINDLGRRAILALRQNLISKIHEYDSTTIYRRFKDLIGQIVVAEIHHIRHKAIILLDDEGNEIILPKEKQIPSDFFKKGEHVRGIIESVELKSTKPTIIMSRTSPIFLQRLFEQEIPEIADGIITVNKVVRIPGEKAKVAVDSFDERIDAVGACVGVRGARIHGIVRELGNENIDVIPFTNNVSLLITRALAPAHVTSVTLNEEEKRADVFLPNEEVSKAIGKSGYNIRLASQLTGYEIDVYREGITDEDIELTEFDDEIEGWIIEQLHNAGLDTAKSVLELTPEELMTRTDLEEETVKEIQRVLAEEFE
ncbi:transcription termination factor NusA [Capnocytophaga leadbetteri]